MTRFRTRRMEPGDAQALNDAYNSLGVSPFRPLTEMQRIWHGGPGGPVKSWIVEADDGAGWRLIGHHGLCPIRFTFDKQDLLFAKTVNSFVLPEFRHRFVYLRFEQRCLAEVEQEFDATYTLAGLAVPWRGALGYDTSTPELDFEQGLRSPQLLSRILLRAARHSRLIVSLRPWALLPRYRSLEATVELNDPGCNSGFFVDFWDQARITAGLAPRRDIADLTWRFWDRPGHHATLIQKWPCGTRGYGIVRTSDHLHFTLEDIFLTTPQPAFLRALLKGILSWCADCGGLMLSFMTTAESQPPQMLAVYRQQLGSSFSIRHRSQHLSRRLTARGLERIGSQWPPMNVTAVAAIA